MKDQKGKGKQSQPEPKRGSWLAICSLFAGGLAAYVIVRDSMAYTSVLSHFLFWMAGSVTLGFALLRLFPNVTARLFQSIGCVAAFAMAIMVAVAFDDGRAPSLRGSINPQVLSSHLTQGVRDAENLVGSLQDRSAGLIADLHSINWGGVSDRAD